MRVITKRNQNILSQEVKCEIGKRIKSLRENKCLSQEDLSGELAISKNSFGEIERGKSALKLSTALAISCFFNVTTEWLFKGKKLIFTPEMIKMLLSFGSHKAKIQTYVNAPDENFITTITPEQKQEIGERIMTLRKIRSLSRKCLALEIHIKEDSLSDIEYGKSEAKTVNILAISEFFNVPTDWLLKGEKIFYEDMYI